MTLVSYWPLLAALIIGVLLGRLPYAWRHLRREVARYRCETYGHQWPVDAIAENGYLTRICARCLAQEPTSNGQAYIDAHKVPPAPDPMAIFVDMLALERRRAAQAEQRGEAKTLAIVAGILAAGGFVAEKGRPVGMNDIQELVRMASDFTSYARDKEADMRVARAQASIERDGIQQDVRVQS